MEARELPIVVHDGVAPGVVLVAPRGWIALRLDTGEVVTFSPGIYVPSVEDIEAAQTMTRSWDLP